MKKYIILSFVCILPLFILAACERDQGVQAGYEQGQTGQYQPRPAPKTGAQQNAQEMTGELQRVDMAAKTITLRVDNGMEQTFKYDDSTLVMGFEKQPSIRDLRGKEGSEVTIEWRDDDGTKVATHVNVTQVSTSKARPEKGKTKRSH